MSKKGRDYVVAVELTFSTVQQAEDFVAQDTDAGERIAFDLDDPEIIALFETSPSLVSEIDYPGGIDSLGETLEKELLAAAAVGADFSARIKWEKS